MEKQVGKFLPVEWLVLMSDLLGRLNGLWVVCFAVVVIGQTVGAYNIHSIQGNGQL